MCAKSALKEPDDGDLLIVGDGAQSLYRRRPFSWAAAGINARGRVINTKFDLDKNYRNTHEILQVATQFAASAPGSDNKDIALQSIEVDSSSALRSGIMPRMIATGSRTHECNAATELIIDWLSKGIPTSNGERATISASEIAVLYPRLESAEHATMESFLHNLHQHVPVYRASDRSKPDNPGNAVTVSTIHASKGLQYRAVILIWTDLLPKNNDEEQQLVDSGLLYVGVTRAEDILVLTRSGSSIFTHRIEAVLAEDGEH